MKESACESERVPLAVRSLSSRALMASSTCRPWRSRCLEDKSFLGGEIGERERRERGRRDERKEVGERERGVCVLIHLTYYPHIHV